jgi:glycerol kinase
MTAPVLVIDQGTTSTRAIVFDSDAAAVAGGQEEFPQIYPRPGWVEHDPEALWRTTLSTAREAMRRAGVEAKNLAALGIANQRETALIWNRATGMPIGNAIVWQDRRTAEACMALKAEGCEKLVTARAGLLLDPYFSATKIAWLIDNVEGARAAAERGELAFGTVDSFLLWRLTNGAAHATDATNASRTLLYDIHNGAWSEELLRLFNVPASILPQVRDTAADFGATAPEHLGGAVPIRAMAGDQQSALIGQACVAPGMVKATYGTGGFLLLNTGGKPVPSRNRLLTTVAYQWRGERTYALEGSIFSAGATVQWLRDGFGDHRDRRGDRRPRRARRHDVRRLLRSRVRRSRRAALELRGPRNAVRPHARVDPQRDRARGARKPRLSDEGPSRGDDRRRGPRD